MKCVDFIETYITNLLGEQIDVEQLFVTKNHIKTCKNCQNNLSIFTSLLDRHLKQSDFGSKLSCDDTKSRVFDLFNDNLKSETKEKVLNHLLFCKNCNSYSIDMISEKLEKDGSLLNYINTILKIKSPVCLLEQKKEKEQKVREAIKTATESIITVKSDGGIKVEFKLKIYSVL